MDKRFALVAVWSLFAGASVGVGFGAAGLVGGPFAAPGPDSGASAAGGEPVHAPLVPDSLQSLPSPAPPGTPSGPAATREEAGTGTPAEDPVVAGGASARSGETSPAGPAGSGRTPRAQAPTADDSSSARSPSEPSRPGDTDDAATAERDIQTRGGYVRASCTDGSLTVAASPAMGWTLDHIEKEAADFAEVRFLQVGGASGRVDVEARCTAQGPSLVVVEDEDGSSGPGGGDGED